jgi:hypothetical protein
MDTLYAVSLGISLSAAGGIRPFFTLLCLALVSMLGIYDISVSYAWMVSHEVVFIIFMLFSLETLGYLYKTRILLNNLFFIALAMFTGFLIMLFTIGDSFGQYKWPVAIFCGATTAGVFQGLFLLVKDDNEPQIQLSYNGYVAVIELLFTALIIALALIFPYVIAICVASVLALAFRKIFFRQISKKLQ